MTMRSYLVLTVLVAVVVVVAAAAVVVFVGGCFEQFGVQFRSLRILLR